MSDAKCAKIITVFNQKGGAGKTTTTCQLAGTFGHRGYDVIVADLDPQQTATAWMGAMNGVHFPATPWSGSLYKTNTHVKLKEFINKYDLIFVDCAPSVEQDSTWSALLVSDLAIVSTKLSPPDTEALPASLELVKKARRKCGVDYPVRILATAFRQSRKDDRLMFEQLQKSQTSADIDVFPLVLGDRVAFTRSMMYGATAHSMPSAKEAIQEIDALADAVARILNIPAKKE